MAAEQFANLSQTTLNGGITNVATTALMTSAATFPLVPQFRIRIDHATIAGVYEFCLVTAVSTNTFTITRGTEGTAGTAFPTGSTVTHVWTAAGITNAFLRADQAQTAVGEFTAPDFKASGVASLANSRNSRYIGSWTTAGAPTGLTAAVADYGTDGNFNMWICTVAGSPGTWQAVGMHKLGQIITTASQVNPSFTGIPAAGYSNLLIQGTFKDSGAGTGATQLLMRLNNDSTASYNSQQLRTTNTTAAGVENLLGTSGWAGIVAGGGIASGRIATVVIEIPNYNTLGGANFHNWLSQSHLSIDNASGNQQQYDHSGYFQGSTVAINRIDFIYTALVGNVITLYGEP